MEVMLKMLKNFMAKTKRSIGQKLMKIRIDHEYKWNNQLWMGFKNKKGFILKFTAAYVHQQNRKVEYIIYTILDTVQSMLFDSELPMKY